METTIKVGKVTFKEVLPVSLGRDGSPPRNLDVEDYLLWDP